MSAVGVELALQWLVLLRERSRTAEEAQAQHWKSGTAKQPGSSEPSTFSSSKHPSLLLITFRLGTGSFLKGSLPSLGAMSSSQCLRRLAACHATTRPASLLRSAPRASTSLLHPSTGVRSLATSCSKSYSQYLALQPRYAPVNSVQGTSY